MRHLTVRNLSPELAQALEEEKRRRGSSLNQTVLDLLSQTLGVGGHRRSNGLARLAGGWTEAEFRDFEASVREFEGVETDDWR